VPRDLRQVAGDERLDDTAVPGERGQRLGRAREGPARRRQVLDGAFGLRDQRQPQRLDDLLGRLDAVRDEQVGADRPLGAAAEVRVGHQLGAGRRGQRRGVPGGAEAGVVHQRVVDVPEHQPRFRHGSRLPATLFNTR
jgi:hypothetical protein